MGQASPSGGAATRGPRGGSGAAEGWSASTPWCAAGGAPHRVEAPAKGAIERPLTSAGMGGYARGGTKRIGWSVASVAALGVCLLALVPAAGSATGLPKAGDCRVTSKHDAAAPSALDGVCELLETREGVVEAALYDSESDRTYKVRTGTATQYTASIVKVDILAEWLRTYDRQGARFPEDIPYSIQYLFGRMIQNSDNAAATALFSFGGGCNALTDFNRLIPMPSTQVGCETATYYGWGNTKTTAADQARLMRMYAYGKPNGVLSADARIYGRRLMQGVEPDQRFGVSCGPWGDVCEKPTYAPPDPDVTVALKNGWKTLPDCSKPIPQCPWQVNSTGWVSGKGRDYVLTVLTTGDPVGSG